MATQPVPGVEVEQVPMMSNAVCIAIARAKIGYTKTISNSKIKVEPSKQSTNPQEKQDTDQRMIHITKDLFDSPELKAILSADNKIDGYLKKRYLPVPAPFKRSLHLLSVDLIIEVDSVLSDYASKRQLELVPAFKDKYLDTVEKSKQKLGPLADPTDYLPESQVLDAFSFNWKYMEFGPAPALKVISKAIYDREQAKAAGEWTSAVEVGKEMIRANFSQLMNHLVTRLTPKVDGKKQVFRKKMLDNVNDFLNTFNAQNKLLNDGELLKLVEQARQLTEGVDPTVLKSNEGLQSSMKTGFEQIKNALDSMLTEAPARAMKFD